MVHISYIEIYNDVAYDLLNASSGASARLPKVRTTVRCDSPCSSPRPTTLRLTSCQISITDNDGGCHIQNLSVHAAPTEDVAQNLLFMGNHLYIDDNDDISTVQAAPTALWPRHP